MAEIVSKEKYSEKYSYYPTEELLIEGINDFLESGDNEKKLAPAIIKTAIATELLLKDFLEEISVALVVEKYDDKGLDIVKLFSLENKMLDKSILENHVSKIKTIQPKMLIERVGLFIDTSKVKASLFKLFEYRNELIHYKAKINGNEANFILSAKIFPFLENISKQMHKKPFKIGAKQWEELRKISDVSIDRFQRQLLKKITFFKTKYRKINENTINALLNGRSNINDELNETILFDDIICPSCKNDSLAIVAGVDFDVADGEAIPYPYLGANCRVCSLNLTESEIEFINKEPSKYFDSPEEINVWKTDIQNSHWDNSSWDNTALS